MSGCCLWNAIPFAQTELSLSSLSSLGLVGSKEDELIMTGLTLDEKSHALKL